MTITVNGVAVPAQSKNLDTTTVTTGFGLVHRQIIGIADPENPSQYARLTGTSLNVNVTNASLAITAAALPLPAGAATEATLASIDTSTSSIDAKLPAVGEPFLTNDPALNISRGALAGFSMQNKYGQNLDVDTGTEDIWPNGGTYLEPDTATTLSLVSTSANDTAAGTGVRTVFISGLNGSYAPVSETVTMNGLTPVTTVNSYIAVNVFYADTAGTGGAAAGSITLTSAATGTPVLGVIPVGEGNATAAIYTVPAGYKAYITRFTGSVYCNTAGAYISLLLRVKRFGGVFGTRNGFGLFSGGTTTGFSDIMPYIEVPEKSVIKISATASTNNCVVRANFGLILVQD